MPVDGLDTFHDAPSRQADDTEIVARILAICDEFEAYGYRRAGADCATEESWSTPRNVRRRMRAHELQPRHRKRFVATTDSAHDLPVFPNLAQGLVPDGPKRRWPWQLSLLRAFRHLPGLTSRAMPIMPNASIADGRSGRAPAAAPGENRPERPSEPFRVRRWPWSRIAALYATCPAGSRRL